MFDSNSLLEELRNLARHVEKSPMSENAARDLATHFLNLDIWMKKGGYPPKEWGITIYFQTAARKSVCSRCNEETVFFNPSVEEMIDMVCKKDVG